MSTPLYSQLYGHVRQHLLRRRRFLLEKGREGTRRERSKATSLVVLFYLHFLLYYYYQLIHLSVRRLSLNKCSRLHKKPFLCWFDVLYTASFYTTLNNSGSHNSLRQPFGISIRSGIHNSAQQIKPQVIQLYIKRWIIKTIILFLMQ